MKLSMTGGKRLASLIEKGIPFKGGVFGLLQPAVALWVAYYDYRKV